jgi:proteic killer suppression protein
VTLVLFRMRRRDERLRRKKDGASRSKKPSEGSRWRLRRTRAYLWKSISARKPLPEAGSRKKVAVWRRALIRPSHQILPLSDRLLTNRIVYLYTIRVIKSYRHKGLKRFAESGSKAGIQPKHADRLRRLLTALDVASVPQDMDAPGNRLHRLEGDLAHHWAVSVSGNWRLTFSFDGEDVILVDYQDYH